MVGARSGAAREKPRCRCGLRPDLAALVPLLAYCGLRAGAPRDRAGIAHAMLLMPRKEVTESPWCALTPSLTGSLCEPCLFTYLHSPPLPAMMSRP
jgi:hypothetical protein